MMRILLFFVIGGGSVAATLASASTGPAAGDQVPSAGEFRRHFFLTKAGDVVADKSEPPSGDDGLIPLWEIQVTSP